MSATPINQEWIWGLVLFYFICLILVTAGIIYFSPSRRKNNE